MNIFRITSRIQREDELAHIRLGFFPFPWMISAAAFFQLVVLHINRKGESDLHNNNRYIYIFLFSVFFLQSFFFNFETPFYCIGFLF